MKGKKITRIADSEMDEFAIDLLETQDWQYVYGPNIALGEPMQERGMTSVMFSSWSGWLLPSRE